MKKQILYKLNDEFSEKGTVDNLTLDELNEVLTPDETFDNKMLSKLLLWSANGTKVDIYRNLSEVADTDSKVNSEEALMTCASLISNLPLKELPDNQTLWNLITYTSAFMYDAEAIESSDNEELEIV